jgi:adenine-specific DNA-methyltransferase
MKTTTLDGKTPDLAEENIDKLKQLFPEVFTEGKIDFGKLQQVLGEYVEDSNERYNFTWNGKGRALRLSQTPSLGTLRPCKEESKDWDTTGNLYIEGDNLEVLKLLQKSYYGKVKLIYIDPPYNTGKDFVYKDDFHDSLENYKKITGQVDDSGNALSTNTEASGRYHTDWLNMMYPRLRLARNLLSDDGVIFVSVDYNEFANAKKILDEIFGEDNFQREIIWRIGWLSGYKTAAPNFIRNHDTILMYSKNQNMFTFNKKYIENKNFKPLIKLDSNLKTKLESLGLSRSQQSELFQFINHDNRPDRYAIEDTWNCNEYDDLNSIAIVSFSGEKISKILDIDQDFKGQKSIKMIQRIIEASANEGDIVMDFFSGTASTAHAVMQLNAEDSGNRKFIMVQLPEITDENSEAYKAGYKNICEIGKERIRRAGEKIKEEKGLEAQNLDIGFKVLKLDTSNIRKWQPDYNDLEQSLMDYVDNYVEGRTELDVVYEIMLKYGLDLTYPVDEFTIAQKKVYSIGFGMLMICLDDEITTDVAKGILEKIKELSPESSRVVFKDNGFKSDSNKTNIKEILKSGGIEEFITI